MVASLILDDRSIVDQYFGITFESETKCIESEEEEVTRSSEHFLQYNCYIDKEVKYLHSGLVNVRVTAHT